MVETLFANVVRWAFNDSLEFTPVRPEFNAFILLSYPMAGALLGALTGRRKAGLLALPLIFVVRLLWLRDFGHWTIPLVSLGVVVAAAVILKRASPWWVAAILASVPYVERELCHALGRWPRIGWTAGWLTAATVLADPTRSRTLQAELDNWLSRFLPANTPLRPAGGRRDLNHLRSLGDVQ